MPVRDPLTQRQGRGTAVLGAVALDIPAVGVDEDRTQRGFRQFRVSEQDAGGLVDVAEADTGKSEVRVLLPGGLHLCAHRFGGGVFVRRCGGEHVVVDDLLDRRGHRVQQSTDRSDQDERGAEDSCEEVQAGQQPRGLAGRAGWSGGG